MPVPPVSPRSRLRRGFTLVELLVVCVIITVLLGILITVIPKIFAASDDVQTTAELSAIAAAIQTYYSDYRAYPGPIPNNAWGTSGYTAPTNGPSNANVTGTENLVLGLCGGLRFTSPGTLPLLFDPAEVSKGAMVLNASLPKRSQVYYQAKPGDLSGGSFQDESARLATDSAIPEFVDKYFHALPILYMRANVGAAGVVCLKGKDELGNSATYQYELAQVTGYTSSQIGLGTTGSNNHHGLQGIVASGGTFQDQVYSATAPYGDWGSGGANALPYLVDPNTPAKQPDGSTATTNALAHPRQKDGFILISAGKDGVYGTLDDKIYPGGSITGQ